ncbi:Ras guanyl-releasing protein 3, partial [Trichinella pseudospiralis]
LHQPLYCVSVPVSVCLCVLCVFVCVCMLFPSTSILETSLLADEADIGRKMLETIVKFDLTDLRFQSRFTTIDQLTQDALLRLGDEAESEVDPLPIALLLIHKWYLTSVELINVISAQITQDTSLWPHTCRLIKLWMRLFPEHFRAPDLDEAIEQLKQQMIKISPTLVKDHFPDLAKLTPYPWSRYSSIKQPLTERISLSFDQWTPENLAVNLTHIEYKLLRRISFEEYKKYATNSQLNAVPDLQKSIASFNSISQWVQCMVLSKPLPRERAEVVTKFVNVAKHLKELKNFNTLMAVIGGLTHSSLARLCRTMACVPHETRLVALNIPYNDEEIYFLSLKREPKTLLQVRSSIQPAPVLADWAEGVQNRVEPSVMQKHVNTMVDVWNILRQELKCEECGIIVHRNCREYLLSSCFRRRNTEPASRHRAFTEPPGSTNSAPSQNSVDDATVSRSNLFSLKRSKRRGAQATATSSTHPNLTVDTTADSKVRSFSEGGPNYINMDSMCESIATLASEEVFETDEACEYDKNVKNS